MALQKSPSYPFVPQSTAHLIPGQFWSIRTSDGRFGCGRVLQVSGQCNPVPSRAFFYGVHDWVGDRPPTSEAIAGVGLIKQGIVHVKTVAANHGQIIGHRPLELDDLEIGIFINGQTVMRGLDPVRDATQEEIRSLPPWSTSGFDVPRIVAESKRAARRITSR